MTPQPQYIITKEDYDQIYCIQYPLTSEERRRICERSRPAASPESEWYLVSKEELNLLYHADAGVSPYEPYNPNDTFDYPIPEVKPILDTIRSRPPPTHGDCHYCTKCIESERAEAAAQARNATLETLDIEIQEIKSRIESSAMGKSLSERDRWRIIGLLDVRVKIQSLRHTEAQHHSEVRR